MKTAEDYIPTINKVSETVIVSSTKYWNRDFIVRLIKQVQVEAWNEALDKAAESAELVECDPMEFYVDKQSILKLKL